MDDEAGTFSSDPKFTFQHSHAATKVMFIPDKDCTRPDLLATTGDFLRIWHLGEDGVQLQKLLNNVSLFHCGCTRPVFASGYQVLKLWVGPGALLWSWRWS